MVNINGWRMYNISFFKERDFTVETTDVIDRGHPVEDSVREAATHAMELLCSQYKVENFDVDEESIHEAILKIKNKCPKTRENPEGLCFLNTRIIRWKSRDENRRIYARPLFMGDDIPDDSLWEDYQEDQPQD